MKGKNKEKTYFVRNIMYNQTGWDNPKIYFNIFWVINSDIEWEIIGHQT